MNIWAYRKKRQAVSPVLATIILIAITLVAAIAVAGFVFGLMGTFTNIALVVAGTASCSGAPEVCLVSLTNTGSGNAAITGACTLTFAGTTYTSTAVLKSGNLSAGNSGVVSCTTPGFAHAIPGNQVVGSFNLGNGASVLFATIAA
ncbi:MAG: type IV pilin N-terminal domain-containing protein [Nitrososphaerales archaeon]|jgi:flagellin-like protein